MRGIHKHFEYSTLIIPTSSYPLLLPLYLRAGGVCGDGVHTARVPPTAVSGFHLVPLRVPLPQQDGLVQRGRQKQRGQTVCTHKHQTDVSRKGLSQLNQQSGRQASPSRSPLLTQATSLTTSVCPATVITALPSTDQILAVLSYDPVRILDFKQIYSVVLQF